MPATFNGGEWRNNENTSPLPDSTSIKIRAVVEAAQALTISLSNTYGDPAWFFKYNGSLDSIACIACECFIGDDHEANCPAKALDDALRALSDSSSQG